MNHIDNSYIKKLQTIFEDKTRKFYHATESKNLPSILKSGLMLGRGKFGSDRAKFHGGLDYIPNIKGIYVGSIDGAAFYGSYIDYVCIIEITITLNDVIMLDEAALGYFYTEFIEGRESSLRGVSPKVNNIIGQLSSKYVVDGGRRSDIKDKIMQDSADGKLNKFIKNKDLIQFAFENDYPIVINDVSPENITHIWRFKLSADDLNNAELDPESTYYDSIESGFDSTFWERIK